MYKTNFCYKIGKNVHIKNLNKKLLHIIEKKLKVSVENTGTRSMDEICTT